mgnify:FL=1|tara:strand:- start:1319 stop:1801 length:483 start_codon:yes stop_codon:yes gene_type:complete
MLNRILITIFLCILTINAYADGHLYYEKSKVSYLISIRSDKASIEKEGEKKFLVIPMGAEITTSESYPKYTIKAISLKELISGWKRALGASPQNASLTINGIEGDIVIKKAVMKNEQIYFEFEISGNSADVFEEAEMGRMYLVTSEIMDCIPEFGFTDAC